MDNFEFGDEITYRQWVTDHSTLMTVVLCEEFIDDLTKFGPSFILTVLYLNTRFKL
jgi:hypothetical protein